MSSVRDPPPAVSRRRRLFCPRPPSQAPNLLAAAINQLHNRPPPSARAFTLRLQGIPSSSCRPRPPQLTSPATAPWCSSRPAGSHKAHHTLRDIPSTQDWYVLSQHDLGLLRSAGLQQLHVETLAGDLLLWDSRTVHCGRRARDALPYTDWRVAFYICMWPAAKLGPEHHAKKLKYLGAGGGIAETTCHWPDGRLIKPRRNDWGPGLTLSLIHI